MKTAGGAWKNNFSVISVSRAAMLPSAHLSKKSKAFAGRLMIWQNNKHNNDLLTQPTCEEIMSEKALTLTTAEIKDLALFAGLRVEDALTEDELETEITIGDCPETGVISDGKIVHYRHICHYAEYPEEGCGPLGKELTPKPQAKV